MSSTIAYAAALFSLLSLLPSAVAGPESGKTYQIESTQHSNLCLAPANEWNGSKLVIKNCDDDDTNWTWNGANIENTGTSKCIDIPDGGRWNGNRAQVWDCFSYNTNQQYQIDGTRLRWGWDFCFDITDGNLNPGTEIQLWQCAQGNTNQMWTWTEVEEVDDGSDDDCEDVSTTVSVTATATAAATATATATMIGGGLWADPNNTTATTSANEWDSTTTDAWNTASATATSTGSDDEWNTASATATSTGGDDQWNATSTASTSAASSTTTTVSNSGSVSSGYLQTSGSKIVDSNGNEVVLRGTNIGGWLVWEDWMCGIVDYSGSADRFPLTTLENRFGSDKANTLWEAWINNWLTEDDFNNIADIGFNVIRLPFGHRNLYDASGNWRSDAFDHLDWAVAQAKKRNIYVILDFHIWAGQEASYSAISENTDDGASQRAAAGEIWKKVATHYLGEPIIAAFDVINEPTGSYANNLQQDLYNAVRSVDANRIIIHESISTDPSQYGWTNVAYSMHEYLMMGSDYSSNVNQFAQSVQAYIDTWNNWNIPTILGEFMADGETLSYILDQSNSNSISWLSWAHSTVNMGRWGLWNHGSMSVDVSSASYDDILNQWNNMPSKSQSTIIYDQFKAGASGSTNTRKRSVSPVQQAPRPRLTARHGGRSRRTNIPAHGIKGISF
ncbi:hypothetical protein I316_04672 [Kwoniella heveanensis BCC8398]|uniref:Uncharacterized protein n=1 Tax=Kwoniella heveanensis BCC8398 TaxID=1296120 RepID=A0A1B9GR94_9TREE|nr:hypothetical protein I316_04672 [Kwoniella heveanensis BCC8398]